MDVSKYKIKFLNIKGEDISDEEYFKRKGISNSRLKLINPVEGGSPQLFKNPPAFEFDTSLIRGTTIHQLFLQESDYVLSDYTGKPTGKLGCFIDYVYKNRCNGMNIYDSINHASEQANYWVGKLTKTRLETAIRQGLDYYLRLIRKEFVNFNKETIVLPKQDYEVCKTCLSSLKNNFEINKLLSENLFDPKQFLNEIALFTDIKIELPDGREVVIPFKGKLDSVIVDPENKIVYLNDLKTTSKTLESFMGNIYINDFGEEEVYYGSFIQRHYYRQLAIYFLMLQMYLESINKADYDIRCNIFAVETTGMNRAKVFKINNSYIQYGINEFKELICRVAWHTINRDWENEISN